MTIQIDYDRKAKEYQWIDPESGEIFTFPPKAKGEAVKFAIGMMHPELVDVIERQAKQHPQLERTLWKAAQIIVAGGVEILPGSNPWAMVQSSDDMGRYAIQNDSGYDTCQCYSFQEMSAPLTRNGQRVCKHIAAAKLQSVFEPY